MFWYFHCVNKFPKYEVSVEDLSFLGTLHRGNKEWRIPLLPANGISKLLGSDDVNVPDEETIFNAVMQWVGYDVQARKQDLPVLLSYIRLPLLPPQVGTSTQAEQTLLLNIHYVLIHSLAA